MRSPRLLRIVVFSLVLADASATWAALGSPGRWTDDPRAIGAGVPSAVRARCRPATGAEIIGRFAGSGDWMDRVTGDVCWTDPRPIPW